MRLRIGTLILLAVLALSGHTLTFGQNQGTSLLHHIPDGEIRNVYVDGNRAYLANGTAVDIYDVSNPDFPVRLGRYDAMGAVNEVAAQGNIAAVAAGTNGLLLLDVSDAANPELLGKLSTTYPAKLVRIKDNYVYFADRGLFVVDISDPANPNVVKEFTRIGFLPPDPIQLEISGNQLHTIASTNGYRIYDITDPAQTKQIYVNKDVSSLRALFVSDNKAHILGGQQWRIFDVSDPTAPKLLSTTYEKSENLFVSGNYAYLLFPDGPAGLDDQFRVYDVSDPASPKLIVSVPSDELFLAKIVIKDGYAYLARRAFFTVWSVSNPGDPKVIFNDGMGGKPTSLVVDQNYLYVTNTYGFKVYDISDLSSPVQVSEIDSIYAANLFKYDKYLYTFGNARLRIWDVSDPKAIKHMSVRTIGAIPFEILVHGNYVYFTDNRGISVLDLSDPLAPKNLGKLNTSDGPVAFTISGNYMYITFGYGNMVIYDIQDLANAKQVASPSISGYGVRASGNSMYLATHFLGTGLHIYDLSDPVNPNLIQQLPSDTYGRGYKVEVNGNVAYYNGKDGLMALDVSDPNAVKLLGSFKIGYLPPHLTELYRFFRIQGNIAYLIDEVLGLFIVRFDNVVTSADRPSSLPGDFALHQNHPNPFNPGTTIAFDLPAAADVSLAIYDLTGRNIDTIALGRLSAGRHRVNWQATASNGRPLPPGVYFYQLKVDGRVMQTRKMSLIK